jgi:hypothetical protein
VVSRRAPPPLPALSPSIWAPHAPHGLPRSRTVLNALRITFTEAMEVPAQTSAARQPSYARTMPAPLVQTPAVTIVSLGPCGARGIQRTCGLLVRWSWTHPWSLTWVAGVVASSRICHFTVSEFEGSVACGEPFAAAGGVTKCSARCPCPRKSATCWRTRHRICRELTTSTEINSELIKLSLRFLGTGSI